MSEKQTMDPEKKVVAEADEQIIDTSKMSEGKRAALEMAESARDSHWDYPTFAGQLFMGELPWNMIRPFPAQSDADRAKGDVLLEQLEAFLRDKVDANAIDRDGEIPDDVIEGLAQLGAFGIKIPTEYGGLGLSQSNYCRSMVQLGSYCGNLSALISAHQSIGVPQPLLMFGTEDQRKEYLPRFAKGEISAFALTEDSVGSDPAKMETRADPSEDGTHFVLNGTKLWCTNGTKAGVIVVMARTPPKMIKGKERKQVTAFIVETDWPGVTIQCRCHFMGLKALYNAVITFEDVKIPKENVILAEGKGLRVALATLNTGRLTLPAICAGASKVCIKICRDWASERVQWGAAIGKHASIADKIARLAANTFAMEAMTMLTAGLVDRKETDIRLEAAMCKMWGTEAAWRNVDETMQIRGGRGYETAHSLEARGEKPMPVERMMRDLRINLIFEGSSEIMRLFIAREALDPHLKLGAAAMDSRLPMSQRMKGALKAAGFYLKWYPRQWLPSSTSDLGSMDPALRKHARYATRSSRKLARALFHSMARHGAGLESQGVLLGRLVDIGTEIFAMASTCSYAEAEIKNGRNRKETIQLADFFCCESRQRIRDSLRGLHNRNDGRGYKLAGRVLEGHLAWLEDGMVPMEEAAADESP